MRKMFILLASVIIAFAGGSAFAVSDLSALDFSASDFSASDHSALTAVRGVVLDQNGEGVENVVVTDGFVVCRSAKDGSFEFETSERARFVYMSTPDGYRQVGDFWHRLVESDDITYTFHVESSDDIPREFVHIGDTEARIHKNWVDVLKEYVAYNKPAFVVFNGDICYEKGLKFHARELTSKRLGTRAVYTLGNHDLVDGEYGEELYEQLFGPVWYSFNSGGVHFVAIPVLYGDRETSYSADDLYSWLKKDLDAIPQGMPVVLMNHHFTGYKTDFVLKGDNVEINLLDYNLKAYLYAHYHVNLLEKSENTGVATIATMSPNKGGIDHTPSSFRVLSFDSEGNLDSRIRYASLEGHVGATLFAKNIGGGVVSKSTGFELVVNVYDTRTDVCEVTALWQGEEYSLRKVSEWTWRTTLPDGDQHSRVAVTTAQKDVFLKVGNKADNVFVTKQDEMLPRAVVTARFDNGMIVKALSNYPLDLEGEGAAGVRAAGIRWVASMGSYTFMTSPVVSEGLVMSATFDDDGKGGSAIHAFSVEDGSVVWRLPVANSVKNNMALWEGTLLACDILGNLYAVDVATGKLLWSRSLREKELHPVYTQGVTVHDGVVYAGHGHYLSAVSVADGSLLWKNTEWRGGVCTVASPVVEPKSGVLLTAAYWTGRFAHDAATGELLWEKRDNDTRIADNSPVYFKGSFFYLSPGYIMEVDPLSGEELVKHKINYVVNNNSRPVVTDNMLIVGTTDRGVVAFDRQNGYKELWNFKTNPGLFYTAPYTKDFQMTVESGAFLVADDQAGFPVGVGGSGAAGVYGVDGVDGVYGGDDGDDGVERGGVVYFGANDGYLYSVNATTGVFRWRINIGAPILGNIVESDGVLYVSDFAGNLWAVEI